MYIKEIVRQVGYLLELHREARSPEYKITRVLKTASVFYHGFDRKRAKKNIVI